MGLRIRPSPQPMFGELLGRSGVNLTDNVFLPSEMLAGESAGYHGNEGSPGNSHQAAQPRDRGICDTFYLPLIFVFQDVVLFLN